MMYAMKHANIPDEKWRNRFHKLLTRQTRRTRGRGWTEAEVERDVTAALREVRKARAARRR
jgi:hypothetical protein